ncbi:glycosyltransferase family 4 protein [Actinomycetospora sp. NBRC 106378]|uniref:glycosyltransferase family 4 protein n=1 Tax=Actinomycetospora sp. NBRC 106378 TaxID=3032208 RepID=UPI0024A5387B|nr:glycosyltransferase family 4 protein [Actinomycetospora sp. NBRC 106378]GLZ51853.1 glycosyltransferase WbuB [Actinomycetospora sp. NBRC 106378]
MPLNVLILGLNYAPEPTGIAPYTTGTARFLADAGHHVHVVTGLPHYPHWEVARPYRNLRGAVLHERDGDVRITRVDHPVPADPTGAGRIAMEAAFALRAGLVRTRRPDVVLAVSPALLTVGAALRWRARGAALGVVPQDLYSYAIAEAQALGGRAAGAAGRLERTLLRRADGVVAIHASFARSLADLGVDRDRITTIRNWSHVTPVDAGPDELAGLRRELGWRDDEIVALHAGNMGAKQGLENVVEAARLADATGAAVRFVLLGTGNQRARLERHGAGIERLQFLDPLASGQFERAMAAADVLVLNEKPGVEEMCVPSKLTSYFAAGRPVVAATGDRSAAAAEIRASEGGVRIEAGVPEDLLRAVLRTGVDREGAAAAGLRGRLFARDALSEDAARAAYVGWVEGLAAGRSSRRPGHARPTTAPFASVPAQAPAPASEQVRGTRALEEAT